MLHLPAATVHRRALTSLALAGVVATACGGGAGDTTDAASYGSTVSALCQALATEDRSTAEAAFWSGAHTPLHDLAKEVADVDRGVASDLLVAKNAVEELLRDEAPLDRAKAGIDRLLTSVQDAVRALGRTVATC